MERADASWYIRKTVGHNDQILISLFFFLSELIRAVPIKYDLGINYAFIFWPRFISKQINPPITATPLMSLYHLIWKKGGEYQIAIRTLFRYRC